MSKPVVKMYNFNKNGKKTLQGQVTVSDNEVRVWMCEEGVSVFRLKAFGKVHLSEYNNGKQVEIVITKEEVKNGEL